ncbi:hypothetical protein ACTHGU_04805 [Chitinophagaceae bacterium MMS25-I14]
MKATESQQPAEARPQPVSFAWGGIKYHLPDATAYFYDVFDAYAIPFLKDCLAQIAMNYVQHSEYEAMHDGPVHVGVLQFWYEWLCKLEGELVVREV